MARKPTLETLEKPARSGGAGSRLVSLVFGVVCYLISLAALLYAIGFIGNLVVPKSIDTGAAVSLPEALGVNLLLLGLFAVSHSVMARPAFKRWWTQFIPLPVERSTYVLTTSLVLALLYWQWRPIAGVVWDVQQPVLIAALWALFGVGWLLVVVSTFLIDHADLFGLRQVYLYARGVPYTPPPFRTPPLYRLVRHPIMLGLLVAFWATPTMTWGHLLFAGTMTAYIFIGVALEERDLKRAFGGAFEEYRQQVGMILPWIGKSRRG